MSNSKVMIRPILGLTCKKRPTTSLFGLHRRYACSTNSTQASPAIAILGAGPAGLMLGRLLARSKIPCTIFERDAHPQNRQASGTLDVHPATGQVALREAGLLDQFNARARHGLTTRIVDSQAKLLVSLGGKDDKQRPEIDRRDLQEILQRSVPTDRIRWGSKVMRVQKALDGPVSITMADGKVFSDFRLVVGADGAWSKVRSLYTSDKPQYAGVNFFTTYIRPGDPTYSATASLVNAGNYLAMNGTEKVFVYPLGDQSYFLSVGSRFAEDQFVDNAALATPAELWDTVLREPFTAWTPMLTDIIRNCDGPFRAWPLYNMPLGSLPYKSVKGATLVGDSAHLSVPTGDGVNNALFDSLQLARLIVKHGVDDLDEAVLEYEKAMVPRAVEAVKKGHLFSDVLFGAGAPSSFLRAIGVA